MTSKVLSKKRRPEPLPNKKTGTSSAANDRASLAAESQHTRSPEALSKPVRQWPIPYRSLGGFVAGLDALLIVAAGLASSIAYHIVVFGEPGPIQRSLAIALFAAVVFIGITRLQKLYSPTQLLFWNLQLNNVIWIWCVTFFLLSAWLFMWKTGDEASRGGVMSFWAIGLVVLLAHRAFWRFFIERALRKGSLRGRRVIVLARASSPIDTKFALRLRRHGYDLQGEFIVGDAPAGGLDEGLARVIAFVRGSEVEEILLLVRGEDLPALPAIAEQLRILPVPVTWVTDGLAADLVRHPWFEIGPAVAIEMQKPPRSLAERVVKRALDAVIAAGALVLLLPVLVLVPIVIKLDSRGPVLFWQTRRGFNGKPFRIAKFRTMHVLEDGDAIPQATRRDARVTRVGAWLRKTSIDEIPQLLNVLRGEMSLVGPRPHAVAHDDAFIETVEHYAYRHHVKPGITGWAQVHGYRGETRTAEAIQRRVEFDRWYIANWSVWLDLAIMLRTLGEVFRGRNAY